MCGDGGLNVLMFGNDCNEKVEKYIEMGTLYKLHNVSVVDGLLRKQMPLCYTLIRMDKDYEN